MKWTQEDIDNLKVISDMGAGVDVFLRAFPGRTYDSIDRAYRRYYGEGVFAASNRAMIKDMKEKSEFVPDGSKFVEYDATLQSIAGKKKPCTLMEVCDLLQVPPSMAMSIIEEAKGRGVYLNISSDGFVLKNHSGERGVHPVAVKPVESRIVFGVASDTHSGSIHTRPDALKDFVHYAYEEFGVKKILHPGDFVAGQGVYAGQEGELAAWGMEAQVDLACKDLPEKPGLEWELIGGNHDYSFMRRNGSDPLLAITRLRKDIHSHGWFQAILELSGIKVELLHPEAGGAYAMSYYLQKHIESTPGGLKPQILLCGHYHQAIWLPGYRNIQGFYAGCFEGQSLYLKRKKLYPIIGGWIFDIGIDEDGSIRDVLPRFVNYYEGKRTVGVVGASQ